jgi:hypothetical protein
LTVEFHFEGGVCVAGDGKIAFTVVDLAGNAIMDGLSVVRGHQKEGYHENDSRGGCVLVPVSMIAVLFWKFSD